MVKELVQDVEPEYKETTDIFNILIDKQERALTESLRLHNKQRKVHKSVFSHECNPYTNMFEFVHYLRDVEKNIK